MKKYLWLVLVLFVSSCADTYLQYNEMALDKPLWEKDEVSLDDTQKSKYTKDKILSLADSFKAIEVSKNGKNYVYTNAGLEKIFVPEEQFKNALEDSFRRSEWLNYKNGKYTLRANILDVGREAFFLNSDKDFNYINVNYTVFENNKIIYQKTYQTNQNSNASLSTTSTGGIQITVYSYELRLMLAVQKNILKFMTDFLETQNHE